MSRVINTNNPTNQRNACRRTIAELLRHLGQKSRIDEEARDMAATIVLTLQEIEAINMVTAKAWEKRDYWVKAEQFLRDWTWLREYSANLDDVIRHSAWDLLPGLLLDLYPRFSDVAVTKLMRKEETWRGNYAVLLAEPPLELPY